MRTHAIADCSFRQQPRPSWPSASNWTMPTRFEATAGCFSGGLDGAHLGRSSPSGHLASHASSRASTSFELDVSEQDGSVVVVDVQTAKPYLVARLKPALTSQYHMRCASGYSGAVPPLTCKPAPAARLEGI